MIVFFLPGIQSDNQFLSLIHIAGQPIYFISVQANMHILYKQADLSIIITNSFQHLKSICKRFLRLLITIGIHISIPQCLKCQSDSQTIVLFSGFLIHFRSFVKGKPPVTLQTKGIYGNLSCFEIRNIILCPQCLLPQLITKTDKTVLRKCRTVIQAFTGKQK